MSDDRPQAKTLSTTELLHDACERAVPIELHRVHRDGSLTVSKARVVFNDEAHIYLDEPQTIGRIVNFELGQTIKAYFWLYDTLFTFDTVVIAPHCLINLNAHKQVKGIAISRPNHIRKGQRRSSFRMSLAANVPVPVLLHEADLVEDSACPIDSKRWRGRLVDVSLGGASILVENEAALHFRIGRTLFLGFTLPQDNHQVIALATIRQVRTLHDGAAHRIGFCFERWPNERHFRGNIESPLQRFIAQLERHTLKRTG